MALEEERPMTYAEVQDLIRAERLWWSESSERQVKRLEIQIEAQIEQGIEQIRNTTRNCEDRLQSRLDEERHERQASLALLRKHFEAQQDLRMEMTQQQGVRSQVHAVEAALKDLRLDVTQQQGVQTQVQAAEAALNDLRREIRDQAQAVVKATTADAELRTEFKNLSARVTNELMTLRTEQVEKKGELRNFVETQLEVFKDSVHAERKERSTEVGELRTAVQASVDSSQNLAAGFVTEASFKERFDGLTTRLESERESRYDQAAVLRADLREIIQNVEGQCKDMTEKVKGERFARMDQVAEVRGDFRAMVSDLEGKLKSLEIEQDMTASKTNDVKSKCDSLSFKVEEMRRNSRASITSDVSAPASASETKSKPEVKPHTVGVQPESTAPEKPSVAAVIGRERAALAARGDLSSQIKAELLLRIKTLDDELRQEIKDKYDDVNISLRCEISEVGLQVKALREEEFPRFKELQEKSTNAALAKRVEVLENTSASAFKVLEEKDKFDILSRRVEALENNSTMAFKAVEVGDDRSRTSSKAMTPKDGPEARPASSSTPGEACSSSDAIGVAGGVSKPVGGGGAQCVGQDQGEGQGQTAMAHPADEEQLVCDQVKQVLLTCKDWRQSLDKLGGHPKIAKALSDMPKKRKKLSTMLLDRPHTFFMSADNRWVSLETVSDYAVARFVEMGFDACRAAEALGRTGGDVEKAVLILSAADAE